MEQFANNPSTTLAAAITLTNATTLSVASSSGFPSGGNFRILIDSELMEVTGISGTTWTVVRGNGGTTAATHLIGANVYGVVTAEAMNALVSIQANGTETSNRRVLNFIGASVADNSGSSRADITVAGASYGVGASKPAAGQAGRIYVPSDGAIISVDTGSAWVGLNPFGAQFTIPPVLSNWTTFNDSGSEVSDIPGGGIQIVQGTGKNSDGIVGCTRSLSSPTSYTISCSMQLLILLNAFPYAGIVITDGTKYLAFMIGCPNSSSGFDLGVYQWTNTTTIGTRVFWFGANILGYTPTVWLRITNDGTNRKYWISMNGITWLQLFSETYNTYLTEASGGIGIRYYTATGNAINYASFASWSGA